MIWQDYNERSLMRNAMSTRKQTILCRLSVLTCYLSELKQEKRRREKKKRKEEEKIQRSNWDYRRDLNFFSLSEFEQKKKTDSKCQNWCHFHWKVLYCITHDSLSDAQMKLRSDDDNLCDNLFNFCLKFSQENLMFNFQKRRRSKHESFNFDNEMRSWWNIHQISDRS